MVLEAAVDQRTYQSLWLLDDEALVMRFNRQDTQ